MSIPEHCSDEPSVQLLPDLSCPFCNPSVEEKPLRNQRQLASFLLVPILIVFFLASQLNLPKIWTQETSSMMYSLHIAEKTSPGWTRSSYLYLIITKSNIAWISSTLNLAKRFYKAWWKASIRAAKFQQSGRPITLLVNIANKNWTMPYSGVLKKVTQQ